MISTNYTPSTKKKAGVFLQKMLLLLFFSGFLNNANATVGTYTFASSTSNYVAITGTTHLSGTWDDSSTALITIPFTFTYNGTAYTTLSINSNGFITMGAVPASVYCGLQSSAVNSIAGYGTDLVGSATSTVQSGTRGTAPNRQFVIQWTDCDHYNNANANHWTFQIILNETSNSVQVVWGNSTDVTTMGANTCADTGTESGDVGLLGGSTQDFNIRSVTNPTNGTNTWTTSTAGTNLSAVCNMSSTNIPAAGLTYTWTPGPILPMTFTSATTTFVNNGQSVAQNTAGNQIIQVQVVVSGTTSPFNVTSLALSTSGSTNPGTDLTNAKVYFTGISNVFSSSVQFGSTAVSPNGAYTASGTATLAEGINYFWITYDVKSTATLGDVLSGCCTQIVGSGTMGTKVPTVTCPAGSQTIASVGTWTALAHTAPSASGGLMLLLSDGTVLAKSSSGTTDGIGNVWNKLTPDIHGSYINGTWSTIASMISTRLYFSSQVLKDGRVYVAGGEYGTGGSLGEVYNPATNVWTATPAPGSTVSDANSEILSDGRVLQALVAGSLTGTLIYNPTTNTYASGPSTHGIHNESAWVKLPDNSVLYIDRLSTASERYIPATNTWVLDGTVPVQLYDAFGDEAGGALLLPDGRAFFLGSSGHTAYYTPSGTSSPGTWAAGPDIPSGKGTPDAPAAMMVNGKILCAVSPVPTSANHFPNPTTFYEFNYLNNTFTSIPAPGGASSLNEGSYVQNFLDLPDGNVLYNDQGNTQYYVYTPGSAALVAGKPVISAVASTTCTTYRITGTQFNGISEGATYGDDWQMATNYPLVRLTSGTNVYYAKTTNWNTTGVQRGNAADTVTFTLPSGLPAGTYSLVVVANGIASDPFTFTPGSTPTLSSSLTPPAICTNTAFTYTPTSTSVGATFTWTRAAVAGISNAAITTAQSSNPNEVLINTTSSPITVIYVYTTTVSGCGSGTQNVAVVVNPLPLPSTISANANTTFCSGSSVVLSGNSTGGTWSIGGGTTTTLTATIAGDYYVTTTNSCGITTSNHISVVVNAQPTPSVISANGNTTFCSGSSVVLSGNSTGGTWSIGGGTTATLTATTAGDYYVTTTNSCGSTTSNHISVVVNAQPTPSVISANGNTTFCSGSSVVLSGNSTGGTWSISGGTTATLTATTAGDYYVTTTNSCGSTTSNHISVVVNAQPTPSVISANGNTTFCSGSSVVLSGNSTGGTWSISGGTTATLTATTAGDYYVTTTNNCGSTTSNHISVVVNAQPTPSVISAGGPQVFCQGGFVILSGNTTGGTWSNVGGTSSLLTVVASGDYYVTTTNSCGSTTSNHLLIIVNPLPVVTAANVTGCAGTPIQLSGTPAGGNFNVSNPYVGSSTNYNYFYTDINGCSNNSSGSITVNPLPSVSFTGLAASYSVSDPAVSLTGSPVGGTFGGSGISGNTFTPASAGVGGPFTIAYTYTDGNGCTNSSAQQTTVTNCVAPAQPVAISMTGGIAKLCPGDVRTYKVAAVSGTTIYNWTVPTGAAITSGAGTRIITVAYNSAFTASGTISAKAANSCGNSIARTLTVSPNTPARPTVIVGSASGVCAGTSGAYSVTAVAGVNFNWTAPANASIATGQGTNTVTINFSPNFTSGTLTVYATNNCSTSVTRTVTITSKPATPLAITGSLKNNCGATKTYSIAAVANATSYTWSTTVAGAVITPNGTSAVVVFPQFTTGIISVTANNGCGSSAPKTITVKGTVDPPASITGATAVTACLDQSYSVAAVTGASSYLWTVPAGNTIVSGQGTTTVLVHFAGASGNITVKGVNACGSSNATALAITVSSCARMAAVNNTTNVNVYPNPSSGMITLEVTATQETTSAITVIDLLGKDLLHYTQHLTEGVNSTAIDLTGFAKGVYFVKIADGKTSNTIRVIIQ